MNSSVSLKVITPPPVEIPPAFYELTLKLTKRDAVAITTLCRKIGGDQKLTARAVFDDIYNQLTEAGINYDTKALDVTGHTDCIYFDNKFVG